jgi:ABC-type transport system involved in cytochrome bd biosynthesis fused ATPase/permease subunit
MDTLKVAFLSSLILELLATVSVALVAVAVGLRLLGGHLDFRTALFVLVLAPEAYLPLRQLGAHYHDSAEGMAAAESVFAVLDAPAPARGTRTDVGDPSVTAVRLDEVAVTYPGRARPALGPLSLTVEPGRVLVVTGPSGAGKSTLLLVLAGLLAPTAGRVEVGRLDLADVDPDAWRAQLALVPQHPHLFATTVAENVRLGRPGATDRELARAVSDAGLDEVVAGLPHGLETRLGEGGHGLSHGERQRVALARAFLRDAPMVLLDEPTSGLDGATEAAVQAAVARLVAGRTVVMVAHRPSLLSLADRVLAIGAPTEEPAADETRPVAERGGR